MEELEAKFRVSLEGKDELANFFASTEQGAKQMQSTLARALSGSGAAISSFARVAGSQLNAFAGKELGGSIGSNARGVLQLRDAINQLAVSSGHGAEITGRLKDEIEATAKASNQLQGDVTAALQAFVERTGDLDTARKNLSTYAKVATATTAALTDIAQVGVDLKEKLDITDQAKSFAILASMAKAGAIELRDLARVGPRIFNVAQGANVSGEAGLREVGALAEVYAKGVGGSGASRSARVATAIENTFASIAKKSARLEGSGVKVQGRDQFDVLFDIIRKTGGNETKLREVFSQQAMRGVMVLANEYKKTGGFGDFERFRNLSPDASLIERDFATRTSTGEAKIKQQQIERARLFDKYLGGAAEFAGQHATELQGGALALRGLGGALSLAGRLTGKGGLGGAGGVLGNITAQRVFVTNWPAGGLTGSPGVPPGAPPGVLGTVARYVTPGLIGAGITGALVAPVMLLAKHQSGLSEKLAAADEELARQQIEARNNKVLTRRPGQVVLAGRGENLGNLDQALRAEVKNDITINIDGDKATAEQSTGTRAPTVMVRRRAAGAR